MKIGSTLPDLPRWVETHSMISTNRAEIHGAGDDWIAVCTTEGALASVVGRPEAGLIRRALADTPPLMEVLCQKENVDRVVEALPDWKKIRARLFTREGSLPIPSGATRLLGRGEADLASALPEAWRITMEYAIRNSCTAASFEEGRPVSFCCSAAESETLWDVSIITHGDAQRKGHALSACSFLIRHMAELGKKPVWGATDDNKASLALASRLGFAPVDELYVFTKMIQSNSA